MTRNCQLQNFENCHTEITSELIFFFEVPKDQEFVNPVGDHEADEGDQIENWQARTKG